MGTRGPLHILDGRNVGGRVLTHSGPPSASGFLELPLGTTDGHRRPSQSQG